VPTPRAGIAGSSSSSRILDRSETILIARFYVSAYFSYQMGICGPAVAFLFNNVTVTTSNPNGVSGQLLLTFNNGQQIQAGGFIGCVVGGIISLEQQLYLPSSWYSPWKFSWQTAFTVSKSFQIDFLELFAALASYLLNKGGAKGVLSRDTANTLSTYIAGLSTFSFVGTSQNNAVSRQITAEPILTLPINILQYIPGLGQFLKALERIKGEVSFGPSFNIGMPVTLSIDRFDVTGGLRGANSASYGNLQYSGNQITATGPVPFDTGSQPSRFTTEVTYTPGLSLGLSCHFSLSACKVFNVNFNSPSLDIFRLMSLPAPVPTGRGSVSTSVTLPACVLEPEMSVIVTKAAGPPRVTEALTAEELRIGVTLSNPYPGSTPGTVTLEIDPRLPDFPATTSVKPGQTGSLLVPYTFVNTLVASGDIGNPGRTQSPTAVAASRNYLIRARMTPLPNEPCTDFESTVPLKVINRVITAGPSVPPFSTPGPPPPWDPNAGITLTADYSLPPSGVLPIGFGNFYYPYAPGQAPNPGSFRVTLYDEKRQPHGTSNVVVNFAFGGATRPAPSATITLTPGTQGSPTAFTVQWLSAGPHLGYPSRFFLVLDGGAQYGSMEYWLQVWNWS
jgi:hypothetical protein